MTTDSNDEEVKLTCEVCGYKTMGVKDMVRHLAQQHGEELGGSE